MFDVTGNPLRKLPEKWSGMKRKYVSGTGYTSRDASEYIARQSRVHPIAVQVWEKMMKEWEYSKKKIEEIGALVGITS